MVTRIIRWLTGGVLATLVLPALPGPAGTALGGFWGPGRGPVAAVDASGPAAAAPLAHALTAAPPSIPRPRGAWRWPVTAAGRSPGVARRFSPGPFRWSAGHRGVDLVTTAGADVVSAGPGTVVLATTIAGIGVVVVRHNGGLRTTYQPVTATVTGGRQVAAGERLGTVSAAGSHCAPLTCLHWGLLRGETYLDPLELLQPVHAVLLRLDGRAPPLLSGRPSG
jgi:murein DD-endopeptidase MepM/ murein hydrolase activator NlpD